MKIRRIIGTAAGAVCIAGAGVGTAQAQGAVAVHPDGGPVIASCTNATCSTLRQVFFSPNQQATTNCDVIWIGITPPNWN